MSADPVAAVAARVQVRRGSGDVLVAGRIGACLVVTAIDQDLGCGGVLRCDDAHSSSDPLAAKSDPCRFVDTGVATLARLLTLHGARLARTRIEAAVASDAPAREAMLAALHVALARANLPKASINDAAPRERSVVLDLGRGSTSAMDSGARPVAAPRRA